MLGFTIKKAAALAAVIAAASLAVASPANASSTPSFDLGGTFCMATGPSNAMFMTMRPNFAIYAANLYSRIESQRVYARAALYSLTTGKLVLVTNWIYGTAFDYDNPAGWFLLNDGTYLGPSGASILTFTVYQHGTYRVQLQFAWEQGSSGAPAGSSPWYWNGGSCSF
ncbi:MAG: hypothetical protein QOE13_2641 [Gaiellaceae bacterium]|jgi:hypothetical protein|nr:hypothetical protein [Gaiellaceae bacterium]